ncbi:MAG: SecD/SecF fusion protein [Candidatus Sumerlaeota bacterium]|nr:SecD/SecF fusion protein [Candidatus Sumerlaeota bacterium]
MNKILNGRMIFVLTVTALSLIFVWPTVDYFFYARSLPEEPSEEQLAEQRQRIGDSSMIKLGLDLQGGVEFLIALDTERMVQRDLDRLAERMISAFRNEKIEAAVRVDNDRKAIVVSDVSAGDEKLVESIIEDEFQSSLDIGDITKIASGGEAELPILAELRTLNRQQSVDAALKTIRNRVNEFGLTQPVVVKQPPDRILVQIPGETDPERIRNGLLRTANLEFRLLHPDHNTEVRKFIDPATWDNAAGSGVVRDEFLKEIPGEIAGTTIKVVDDEAAAALLPANYSLFLGKEVKIDNAGQRTEVDNLAFVLKSRPELTGDSLRRAQPYTDVNDIDSPHKVLLEFNREGTEKFAEVTTDHTGERFAIVLDGKVYSSPRINEPILYGNCEISGTFTQEEAQDLTLVLKAGSLPAPLQIINEQAIGASLGKDSVIQSGQALIIGAVVLVIMMIIIYQMAGFFAIIAMILNVLLILAILSLANATLTLSGIGGILLTMGMAVDANVLIYERLREELESGKPFRAALNAAFGRAFSVILDSNITTLLPALVLLAFEIAGDSVKGFWTALAIGLIANLYTGLTVTRALIEAYVAKKKTMKVGHFVPFKNANYDFMKYRRVGVVFTSLLVGVSIFYLVVHGVNPGIDFTGGVVATVEASDMEVVTRPAMQKALEGSEADGKFDNVKVVKVLNEDIFQVTVPKKSDGKSLETIREQIEAGLSGAFGEKVKIVSTQSIESVVGSEFKWSAFFMLLVASLVILGYLAFRFRPIYGLGAVAALVHDLLISLGIFVALGHNLTLDIVSALMIILGYSVNDTIVVFDRIRESSSEMYGKSIGEIINYAINKTLSRTVFTSGTTLVAVLSMLLFGGVGLKDFALILLLGIGVGTYSSIFVASAMVYVFIHAKEKREGIVKAQGQRTKTVKIGA